jgi:hypothetical protein
MAILFHQNMRNFGGGAAARNAAYNQQFAAITGGLGAAGPIAVAGFTEVTNDGAAATAFGPGGVGGGLCAALGVVHLANIACGITALANGPEYVAIGVNAGYAIQRVGRIFVNAEGYRNRISLFHDISPALAPTLHWRDSVYYDATNDYRGVVYVIVQVAVGVNIAVGFLHNTYTLDEQAALVMTSLPHMMALMGEGIPARLGNPPIPAIACAEKYIGGDFNVGVRSPRGTARIGFCYAYSNWLMMAPPIPGGAAAYVPPPPPPAFVPGGTLWRGNLYDYWYSSNDPNVAPAAPLVVPVPSVDGGTLDSVTGVLAGSHNMSDHCAIGLQII